tara:strand:- start:596 stop:1117 length:522 start_codon:yes stop_codon:yes gene_type:complete
MLRGIETECLVECQNKVGETVGINFMAAEVLGRLMRMSMSSHNEYDDTNRSLSLFKKGSYTGEDALRTADFLLEASQAVQDAKRLLTVKYVDYTKTYQCKFANTGAWLCQERLDEIINFLRNSPEGFDIVDGSGTFVYLPPFGPIGTIKEVSLPETTEFAAKSKPATKKLTFT